MVLFSWYINPTSLRFFLLDVTFCTTFRFLPHQPNLWPTLHSGRVFCCEPTTRISPSTSSDDMLTKFCTDVQQQKHLLDSTLDGRPWAKNTYEHTPKTCAWSKGSSMETKGYLAIQSCIQEIKLICHGIPEKKNACQRGHPAILKQSLYLPVKKK